MKHALKMLTAAPCDWPRMLRVAPVDEDISDGLADIAVTAAYLSEYLAHSELHAGHAAALRKARAAAVKVRRALGFSYPANTPWARIDPWQEATP